MYKLCVSAPHVSPLNETNEYRWSLTRSWANLVSFCSSEFMRKSTETFISSKETKETVMLQKRYLIPRCNTTLKHIPIRRTFNQMPDEQIPVCAMWLALIQWIFSIRNKICVCNKRKISTLHHMKNCKEHTFRDLWALHWLLLSAYYNCLPKQ